MNNMRRGFTMIELIFVIVIIGILAAVAIPKLAATRDDAESSTCVHEIGQLIQEMSASYTKLGNTDYIAKNVSDITNVRTGLAAGAVDNGLIGDPLLNALQTYTCGGTTAATFLGANAGVDFNLTVTTTAVTGSESPANAKTKQAILDDVLNGALTKIFKL